jgi:hypothetical protein
LTNLRDGDLCHSRFCRRHVNHKLEVEEDSCERHKVETARAEQQSPELVNQPHYLDVEWSSCQWVLVSEIGDLQTNCVNAAHPVLHQRSVVESRNVCDSCERDVLHDDAQNVWQAGQYDHHIYLYDQRNDCAVQTHNKCGHYIVEVFSVVDDILHHLNTHSNVFLHIDVHHH